MQIWEQQCCENYGKAQWDTGLPGGRRQLPAGSSTLSNKTFIISQKTQGNRRILGFLTFMSKVGLSLWAGGACRTPSCPKAMWESCQERPVEAAFPGKKGFGCSRSSCSCKCEPCGGLSDVTAAPRSLKIPFGANPEASG